MKLKINYKRKPGKLTNMWILHNMLLFNNNAYIRKQEISKKKNLNIHLKKLEKEEQIEYKISIKNKLLKIRSEINERD